VQRDTAGAGRLGVLLSRVHPGGPRRRGILLGHRADEPARHRCDHRHQRGRLDADPVGELSTQTETFRRLWGSHDVRTHGTGTKRFHHPDVGDLTLAYEELAITAEPGLILMLYTAEPATPSADKMRLLASLAADGEPTRIHSQ